MEFDKEDASRIADAVSRTLLEQRKMRVERGFYWENQVAFAYNSDKIEGSTLSKDQIRMIFETETVAGGEVAIDDILEAANHFRLFDFMLDTLARPLDIGLLKDFHRVLKRGTPEDLYMDEIAVGGFKTIPNGVDGVQTTPPDMVEAELSRLLDSYASKEGKGYREVTGLHVFFERIHPFQDGNGRVGRMMMFRECLANSLVPFIVIEEERQRYYASLRAFDLNPESIASFAADMADLYFAEYSALVPEYYLLPKYRNLNHRQYSRDAERFFSGVPSPGASASARQEDFDAFLDGVGVDKGHFEEIEQFARSRVGTEGETTRQDGAFVGARILEGRGDQ